MWGCFRHSGLIETCKVSGMTRNRFGLAGGKQHDCHKFKRTSTSFDVLDVRFALLKFHPQYTSCSTGSVDHFSLQPIIHRYVPTIYVLRFTRSVQGMCGISCGATT